jgi:hypothetical protein
MEPTTKYRRFLALLPEMEQALRNGHSHEACRKHLRDVGLELSTRGFANYLYLARREQRNGRATLEATREKGTQTAMQPTLPAEHDMEMSGLDETQAERRSSGAIVTSSRPKDRLTNKNPNLDDLL